MKRIICRIFGHRWRMTYEETHVVTGDGMRHYQCTRCPEVREEIVLGRWPTFAESMQRLIDGGEA